jgi:hypothetical protein
MGDSALIVLRGALELGDGDIVPTMQNELAITAGAESHVAEAEYGRIETCFEHARELVVQAKILAAEEKEYLDYCPSTIILAHTFHKKHRFWSNPENAMQPW